MSTAVAVRHTTIQALLHIIGAKLWAPLKPLEQVYAPERSKAAYTPGRASAQLTFSHRASAISLVNIHCKRSRSAGHMLRKEVASVVQPRKFHSSSR